MSWSLDDALDDPLVHVLERDDDVGHYLIRIGVLQTAVAIELGRFLTSEDTRFRMSHVIKTPGQADAYRTSRTWDDSPGAALHKAVSGITEYYKQAVREGHTPEEGWLVRY